MRTITATELKNGFDEYVRLAESEPIEVTDWGSVVFTMVPERQRLAEKLKGYFGILPEDAAIGKDPDERN